MKKFLCFLLTIMCIVPTVALAGCSNNEPDASYIANRTYHVTNCKEDLTNLTDTFKDGVLKIYFFNENFKVELTNAEHENLSGYYIGTYTTNKDVVNLTITERAGFFETNSEHHDALRLNFKTMKFKNNTLEVEDIVNGKLIQFTFSEAKVQA